LGIYFFYDPEGVVDEYVMHFLGDLNGHLSSLVVVCNGKLTAESRELLETLDNVTVIVRDNTGFDVWAYKAGLDYLGWDTVSSFDELIMVNFTIMGPVGSFSPMFDEMDRRSLDFWGITVHHGADFDPWEKMPDGNIPLHIQSHFIAVRARMLKSPEFQRYWNKMVPIASYEDSIAKHESLFTQRFERAGFRWGVYVDTTDLVGHAYYPLFNYPVEMIVERGSPIFKRKLFFSSPEMFLGENSNRPARQLADYLRASDFDFSMVMRHSIRSANQFDLATALNLFEIVSADDTAASAHPTQTVAALVGLRTLDELDGKLPFLKNLPPSTDVFITIVGRKLTESDVRSALAAAQWSGQIQVVAGGRDHSAVSAWRAVVPRYDLICVVEAFEASPEFPGTNQDAANLDALESALASRSYVERVMGLFAKDDLLGLVVPPAALHHEFHGLYGHEWDGNFTQVVKMAKKFGLRVALSESKPVLAPASGIFWGRSEALSGLLANEPLMKAVTVDIERYIYPIAVQSAGFYPITAMPELVASNFITNATHAIRQGNIVAGLGRGDSLAKLHSRLKSSDLGPDGHTPRSARLYVDTGKGMSERGAVVIRYPERSSDGGMDLVFPIPAMARALRFDPVEANGSIVKGIRMSTDRPGLVEGYVVNGVREGHLDFFSSGDPQYMLTAWPEGSRRLRVHLEDIVLIPQDSGIFSGLGAPKPRLRSRIAARVRRLLGRGPANADGIRASPPSGP
jgi:rhamnosyltransferase